MVKQGIVFYTMQCDSSANQTAIIFVIGNSSSSQ